MNDNATHPIHEAKLIQAYKMLQSTLQPPANIKALGVGMVSAWLTSQAYQASGLILEAMIENPEFESISPELKRQARTAVEHVTEYRQKAQGFFEGVKETTEKSGGQAADLPKPPEPPKPGRIGFI